MQTGRKRGGGRGGGAAELQPSCSPRSSLTHWDIRAPFTTPINSFAGL